MGRVEILPPHEDENIEIQLDETDNDAFDLADSIAAEFGRGGSAEYTLKVYRVTSAKGQRGIKDTWLFDADQAEYQNINTRLRDEYGTGLYRVRMYASIDGRTKNVKSFDVPIEAAPRPSQNSAPSSDVKTILEMMAETNRAANERMEKMMERVITSQVTPPIIQTQSPMEMMKDMLAVMASMKTLQPSAPVSQNENPMELFRTGVEFAKELVGDNRERGMMDILDTAIKNIPWDKLGMAMMGPPPGARPNPIAQPRISDVQSTPAPKPEVSPAPEQPHNPQENQIEFIRGQLEYLLTRARKHSDPQIYAELLYDNLTEPNIPPQFLQMLVEAPDAMDRAKMLAPDVANHEAWFLELLDALKLIVQEEHSRQSAASHVEQPANQDL